MIIVRKLYTLSKWFTIELRDRTVKSYNAKKNMNQKPRRANVSIGIPIMTYVISYCFSVLSFTIVEVCWPLVASKWGTEIWYIMWTKNLCSTIGHFAYIYKWMIVIIWDDLKRQEDHSINCRVTDWQQSTIFPETFFCENRKFLPCDAE